MKLIVALAALVLSASTAFAGGYYGSTGVYVDDPDIYDPVPSVVVTRRVVYAPPPPPVYHVRRTVYVGGPRPVPYYGHYGYGPRYGGGFYGVRRAYHGPSGFYSLAVSTGCAAPIMGHVASTGCAGQPTGRLLPDEEERRRPPREGTRMPLWPLLSCRSAPAPPWSARCNNREFCGVFLP